MLAQLKTLYRYRLLIHSLVSRELKARYRGSVLGFLWSFVNPLLLLVTYGVVFTYMLPMRAPSTKPYFVWLFCGLLPWTWFNQSVMEAAMSLIGGGNLIKKVLFPAEVLPVVTVFANMVHFALGLPILFVFLVWYGKLSPALLLLPLPILVQLVFTLGVALFVSALTVHFRDLQNILSHLLQLWFFATPIIYPYADAPAKLQPYLRLNPLMHVMLSYQQVLFGGHFDHWRGLFLAFLVSLVAFAVGGFLFERLRDTLAEEV
jgi:homopolymeric O-antigen transport system permease protein